jgi:hypothetical protein
MPGEFCVAPSAIGNAKSQFGPHPEFLKTTPRIFGGGWTVVQEDDSLVKKSNNRSTKDQFTLILAGISELTPEVTDALYEAGFDDALVGMVDGVPYIDVNHRESASLAETIRAAIRDVERAGFRVVRVESDVANVITRINADLLMPSQG